MTVQAYTYTIASQTVTTTTETIVGLLQPIAQGTAKGANLIFGYINITAGTAATTLIVRVRAGNLVTGTLIGNADTITVAATVLYQVPFAVVDTVTFPYGNQYVVTVQQGAATGNATVNDTSIILDVISPAL